MERVNLTKEQKEEITAVMRSFGVAVGYLFGSYARGTANLRSDIDVAVAFSYKMAADLQENRVEDIRNDLEKIFGADKVDILNVGTVKNPFLLYTATLGEGTVLFADDISLKNSIAMRVLRDFEDTEHLRKIQSESVKKLFA